MAFSLARLCLGHFGWLMIGLSAQAGVTAIHFDQPTLDRWNYPFNTLPGTQTFASIFAPLTSMGFDDRFDNRDGQLLLGFDTASMIPAGQGVGAYEVLSATVTITIESDETFAYDPTPDAWQTYLLEVDPNFFPDSDTGRALEIFGSDFREGETALTYAENDPYSTVGVIGKELRIPFPINFDDNGVCFDISNNVDNQFDPVAFGVATTNAVAPGGLVPADTTMTFELNVADAEVQYYLRRALQQGYLSLSIASLFPSQQQQQGGFPRVYTKDNIAVVLELVDAAQLDLTVDVTAGATYGDADANGAVDVFDLLLVLSSWGECPCCLADVNADGNIDVFDLLDVLSNWS